jgi:hypothetical protein
VCLPLNGCADASGYSGVQFSITGDLGTCGLVLSVITAENNDAFSAAARHQPGSCIASSCYGPSSPPLALGTIQLHFSDLSGGSPDPVVDPAQVVGLCWQLMVPTDSASAACVANFTITDIAFTSE